MMFRVWRKPKKKEPKVFVRFTEEPRPGVVAYLCDEDGRQVSRGALLAILSSGELCRPDWVNEEAAKKAGVPLDSEGRWELDEGR